MHTTPRTCLHWQIYQREFKLRWCYPSLAASSKDCREEQTQGWIWQGYFRVQRWDCCLEMPRHLRGAQPSSQTTSGWRPPPCQAREAEERGKRPAKGTSLGASSPGAWCTCPCRGPAAPALGRWTHCPMARSALRVHGPPPPVLFFACLTLLFSQPCTSVSLHSDTSSFPPLPFSTPYTTFFLPFTCYSAVQSTWEKVLKGN